mmetsp:Transcript_60329/g.168556  ORF Transcript_60329/g.168556 Transcript_60329/m.168556 type:complete len:112 (+) Transcript_60329:107-442(+)
MPIESRPNELNDAMLSLQQTVLGKGSTQAKRGHTAVTCSPLFSGLVPKAWYEESPPLHWLGHMLARTPTNFNLRSQGNSGSKPDALATGYPEEKKDGTSTISRGAPDKGYL